MNPDFGVYFSKQKSFFKDRLQAPSVKVRKRMLKRLKAWIIAHKQDIRNAIYTDFRKPEIEVDLTDIKTVLWEIDHALASLNNWTAPVSAGTTLTLFSTRASVVAEPLGVVLIIAPWNFPFNLCVGPLVSALAAGNCIFLKPSELTPATSSLIAGMVRELFSPEEVVAVEGDASVAKKLLELPFDHIFFTGSTPVGKHILAAASTHYAGVTLELGGMNPAVVAPGSNFNDVAQKILYNKGMNAAQSCLAINVVLIQKQDEEAFTDALKKVYARMYPPNGDEIAAIINDAHFQRITRLVDDARQKGAEVVLGGAGNAERRYMPVTVLRNVAPGSLVLWEEIFGPILPIVTVNSLNEAIDFIQKRPKPLATYVFSNSSKFTNAILSQTSSGTAVVNDTTLQFIHPHLPFGGVNHSGSGKAHGYAGFLAFSNQKSILRQVHGFSTFKLVFPPYTNLVKKITKILFDWF